MKDDRAIYPCCDSNLNFSTATCSEDDCEYGPYKKSKVARQDPMSHRIIEKRRRDRMNNCLADLSRLIPTEYLKKGRGRIEKTEIIEMAIKHIKHLQSQEWGNPTEHYRLGYQECVSEAMRFMVEVEGHFPREPICVRLLNHLQKHGEQIIKGPTAFPSSPTPEQVPTLTPVSSLMKNGIHSVGRVEAKPSQFTVPKAEPENSNSNDAHPNAFIIRTQKSEEFDKESGNNGMSYKYKTNIKLRFNQDLNAHEVPKRQKLDDERRNSITSFENQSSNQSSPPSSEACTRVSESENTNRQTPPDLSNSNSQNIPDTPRNDAVQRFSPSVTTRNSSSVNFDVPVFVLHTKGSYYIPLTIDYKTLIPYLQNYNIIDVAPSVQNLILHPVTINVNFLPNLNSGLKNCNYKYEYNNNWH